ncbi:uncharacterized protein PHACADRAFT_97480 [Phanerochaete carnosa HHB-10118-sp]|uniref:Uncharacterized protein n=1 Tax=Phanerochaete carnosa (strain HHB-10118-sp) TaxID=650164 RepID=K5W5N2_PHACS|nr:uncharacterized protein PHACADRAFT_97480 [Phanerochaete carnosa HHB-10118-sp]EKM54264.1 hypothetical protein PHACADRAFT_97480 [Phanerochaete carnosa HHB-10118-sp]
MASKFADHTLYHLSPKGFWKKFRTSCFVALCTRWLDAVCTGDAVVINPEISSGLPIQGVHRYPPPASRPEKYSTPATKASDPAQNPYWKRDVRRAYPQLSVVTQTELSTLLIEHHDAKQQAFRISCILIHRCRVAAPAAEGQEEHSELSTTTREPVDLTAAIFTITQASKIFSESKLPPSFPTSFKRWKAERAEDAPHDPSSYFPMLLVK